MVIKFKDSNKTEKPDSIDSNKTDKPDSIELIINAKNGDLSAFETIVSQNYMFVYTISYKWCGVKKVAEDITQDVFIKLTNKINTFKDAATFKKWLYIVTINTAKDFNVKSDEIQQNETTSIDNVQLKYDEKDNEAVLAEKVLKLIKKMPDKLKETAILFFAEGLYQNEVAEVLDCEEKTISLRVLEIKKSLCEFFGI